MTQRSSDYHRILWIGENLSLYYIINANTEQKLVKDDAEFSFSDAGYPCTSLDTRRSELHVLLGSKLKLDSGNSCGRVETLGASARACSQQRQ